MAPPERFYVRPTKPVAEMTNDDLDDLAHTLTRMTKQLVAGIDPAARPSAASGPLQYPVDQPNR